MKMKNVIFFSIMFLWKKILKIIIIWKQKVINFIKMKKNENENEPLKVAKIKWGHGDPMVEIV